MKKMEVAKNLNTNPIILDKVFNDNKHLRIIEALSSNPSTDEHTKQRLIDYGYIQKDTKENIEIKINNQKFYSKENEKNLMPKEIEEKIPELYEQEKVKFAETVVHAAYIIPFKSNWTWYVTEYDSKTRNCFGLVAGFEVEMGYFNLNELEELGAERLILEDFPKTFKELKDTQLKKISMNMNCVYILIKKMVVF